MTIHCGKCRKTLVSGPIVIAKMQKVEFDEITETTTAGNSNTVTAYYCEDCMRSVH